MQSFITQIFKLITGERLSWIRKLALVSALALVAMVSTVQPRAQSTLPFILVKAGRLLDPRTGNVLAPAAVLIEGDRIKQVGPPSQIHTPVGTTTIDLGNATLLPGLIDSHTHLFLDVIVPPEAGFCAIRMESLRRACCWRLSNPRASVR